MTGDEKRSNAPPTFEAVLTRLIQLARGTVEASNTGLLAQALDELDREMALKVRTLMIAGREGRDIATVQIDLKLEDADTAFAAAAREASENGPLLADYLQRGHALACAAGLDLEKPVSRWMSTTRDTLDERAWSSFGRQLASSKPDDWQCLGFVERGGHEITRLYVKLSDHAWWSFQSVLDRPSAALVSKEKQMLASRRAKGVTTSSLEALVARLAHSAGGTPASTTGPSTTSNLVSTTRSSATPSKSVEAKSTQLKAAQSKAAQAKAIAVPSKSMPSKSIQGRALQRAARAIMARVGHGVELR
jgi:hypothetical protein